MKETLLADARLNTADAPFVRLWRGFLLGRVMIAVALLVLQILGRWFNQVSDPVLMAVCGAYLCAAVLLRILGRHAPCCGHGRTVASFHRRGHCSGQRPAALAHRRHEFHPLFGLPILMAAVLGTLTLALGTTAAVTLLLLLWAWWSSTQSLSDDTQRYLQSALTGTGYFVVTYLVHQLATRLVGEQEVAQRSKMAAQVQTQVSALVIEHLSDGVLVVDESDVVRMANPAAQGLLGRASTPSCLFPGPVRRLAASGGPGTPHV